MKTNNQFDASIKSLTDNIPVFVREAYSTYLTIEDELFSDLRSKFVSQPNSVDSICGRLLSNGDKDNSIDIISTLRILNGCEANDTISRFLGDKTEVLCKLDNIEAADPESPDIYAPLSRIVGGFTNMPNSGKKSFNHTIPSIIFQLKNKPFNQAFTPDNSLGFKTILDDMSSECIIDLFDLFDIFYTRAVNLFTNAQSDSVELEAYETTLNDEERKTNNYKQVIKLHEIIRESETSNEIINAVTKDLLKTIITTYLIFAGKLRGVKSDLCSWMYTFFVKDSMRDVEKGDYPTSSDITLQAGMQTHQNVLSAGDPNEKDYPNNAADRRNITSSYYKIRTYNGQDPNFDGSVFYKNIRLLYSNWASVINTIIKIDRNENNKIHYEDEDINSLRLNNHNSSSILYEHIKIARNLMEAYLSCRFRTYNTPFQLEIEKGGVISNDALLKSGINALVDIYNKATVKDCCSTEGNNYFISNSDEIQFVLNSTRAETGVIADKFMASAYLIMLDYIHTHQEQIITQDDPNTGKPNREQFEEVYEAVKKSVYSFVFKSYNNEDAEIIARFNSYPKNTIVKMTIEANGKSSAIPISRSFDADNPHSILVNGYNKFNISSLAGEDEDNSISNEEIKSYQYNNLSQMQADLCKLSTIAMNYIVPPLSDEIGLKLDAMQENVTNEPLKYNNGNVLSQYQTRATSMFPKNQVVLDELSKLRMNTKGIFSSMESSVSDFGFDKEKINEVCDKVESSIESEWAHMSYNDIASIGGEVVDFEVTNEETAATPNTEKEVTENPILDSSDPQAVTLHAKDHDVDIKENVIADKEPKDSEYIKEITEATESLNVINRYNKLFNKVVFNI